MFFGEGVVPRFIKQVLNLTVTFSPFHSFIYRLELNLQKNKYYILKIQLKSCGNEVMIKKHLFNDQDKNPG